MQYRRAPCSLGTMNKILRRYFQDLPREVAVAAAIAFCVALGFGIVAPVLPLFAESFGVSALAASAVISLFGFMRFVSATPAGWLVNKLGERWVLVVGLSIVAISSALAGTAHTYTQLLLLRAGGGTGSAMFTVAAMSLLLHSVDPEHRGRAISTYQSGFLLGGLAGPFVGGLVVGISMRAPFFVYAGTVTLAACTALFALPKKSADSLLDDKNDESEIVETMQLREALSFRAYWTAMTVNLVTGMTSFGLRMTLIPLFVLEVLHKSAQISSMSFLVSSITQAMLLLPVGRLIDVRGRKPALVIGCSILTTSFVVLTASQHLVSFFLSMMMMGAASAFLGAAPSAMVGDIVKTRRGGQVVGLYQMTGDLGVIVGPLLAGYLKDTTGGYTVPFMLTVAFSAVALFMSVTVRETKQKNSSDLSQESYETTSS